MLEDCSVAKIQDSMRIEGTYAFTKAEFLDLVKVRTMDLLDHAIRNLGLKQAPAPNAVQNYI